MKTNAILVAITLAFICCNTYADDKKVRLLYGDYPPYYGPSLKHKGPIAEIIVEAYKLVDYQVELNYIPSWARSVQMTKSGQFDGVFSAWYREDRERWFVFTDPLPPNKIGFYKRKDDNITFTTLDDLIDYKVGGIIGYINSPKLEKAHLRTEQVVKESQNIGKLLLRRIDLALIDKDVAQYVLSTEYQNHAGEIEWIDPPLEIINQHLIISKNAQNFQEKSDAFNTGLKILTAQGRLDKIMKKHGL